MEERELLSFATGGTAFLLLGIALLRRQSSTPLSKILLASSALTILWCYLHAGPIPPALNRGLAVITVEQLRNGAWLALLLQTLPKNNSRFLLSACHLSWIVTLAAIYYHFFSKQPDFENPVRYDILLWLIISVTIVGLVIAEQAYRNTLAEFIDSMRFIYIAIAGSFAYDLYFYVHTLLFNQVNSDIAVTRGVITAIVALLIYFSLQRISNDKIQFRASRNLVFYSTSLIVTGSFLFIMALGGYYIRRYGGNWGLLAQALIVFGATTFILTLISSKRIRANFRVLLSKHLFRHRYDYREEWLRLIHTLTSAASRSDINMLSLKAMTEIFQTEGGALWLMHDNKLFIQCAHIDLQQTKSQEIPANSSLQRYMESTRHIIVIEEYKQFPERYPELDLPTWMQNEDFWLIIPLMLHNTIIGFILLQTPPIKRRLSWEDFDLLKTAGLQIASFLAAEQSSRTKSESKQFDAYSRLTAFIMHDLKNLIAQQSLVVKNAAKHKDNPEFIEDAINTIDNSVKRMSRLLDQLKQGNQDEEKALVCLQNILIDAVRKCHNKEPRPSLHMVEQEIFVNSSAEQLSMILGHVIRNAQDATDSDGFIDVSLSQNENTAIIEVEDNGIGMSQEFVRERLFKPFDSTKASKGMGIGAYQTREFIRHAGGDVEIISEEGKGTTFCILLPVAEQQSAAKIA